MKKALLLFATLMALGHTAFALQFSAVAPTGQTIYFYVSDNNAIVTYPGFTVGSAYSGYRFFYYNYTHAIDRPNESLPPTGNLTIPDSVRYNGITYPVTSIGDHAFDNCSGLTSVTIPNSVTSIGDSTFIGCIGLSSVTIPNSVTSIGKATFRDCSGLTSVVFNADSCISVGGSGTLYAFYGCSNLTSITLGNNVKRIPSYLFYNLSSMTSVTIPNLVKSIGNYAFYNCSGLTSATIPNPVKSIGDHAFYNCSGLTSVTIGNSVTSIGGAAFSGCTGLDTIHMLTETPPTITSTTFNTIATNLPVTVPCGSTNAYNTAPYWNVFTNIQEHGSCNSTLTLTANDTRRGSVLGAGRYRTGSTVEIMAVPKSGCQFLRWNDNNTANPRSITLTSDTAFTALFDTIVTVASHTLTVTSANVAMGTATGGGTYTHGTVVLIVASANNGYHFTRWNDGNTDNPRALTLTQDTSITAMFAANPVPFNVTANNAVGGGVYPAGSTAMIYALPQVDLQFAGWSDGETANPRYVVVAGDTTLTALYRAPDTVRIYDTTTVYDTVINIIYDTTEYNHYYYDTTRVFDTMVYVNNDTMNHYYFDTTRLFDTMVYVHADTLHHYQYDTTRVFDTMVYVNIDTIYRYYFDTTWVFDTTMYVHADTLHHYHYDTTRVFDTMIYVNIDTIYHYYFDTTWVFDTTVHAHADTLHHYHYDTLYTSVYVHDTTYINTFTHDTIAVRDTVTDTVYEVVYVDIDVYVHDTTYIPVYNYDTITVRDTITNTVHDVTYICVYVHDTIVLSRVYDTIINTVYDTVTNILYDTIDNYIHDTTLMVDTLWLTRTDTIYLHDTLYVHDTVYIHDTVPEGISGVATIVAKVYTSRGQVVVEGAEGNPVTLYDLAGRALATRRDGQPTLRFDVPASGTYLIKIGNRPARKIVVIK